METTKESKFVGRKNKPSLRQLLLDQKGFQNPNQMKIKKTNFITVQKNNNIPSKTQKEMNKEKNPTTQQNQAPKNIWMNSIRDIIRDEPIKITHTKKQPAPVNKNSTIKTPLIKPKNTITENQSSKPVFTISASLKNSMQQQSPKIKNNSDISKNQKIKIEKSPILNAVENQPIVKNIEPPKLPSNTILQTKEIARISPSFHKSPSPSIPSNRFPSPSPNQSIKNNKSRKSCNRKLRCISVFVFLVVMFLIMFFLPYLL